MAALCKNPACGLPLHPAWTCARAKAEAAKVANKPDVVANVRPVVANRIVEQVKAETAAILSKHGKYADQEKRKAYMRELMRKRRSAQPSKC